MKNASPQIRTARFLPAFVAVTAAGLLGAASANAAIWQNNTGDGLWSTPANWNKGVPGTDTPNANIGLEGSTDEALLNYNAPDVTYFWAGQRTDGFARMTSGSITANGYFRIADATSNGPGVVDRTNGRWTQQGGILTLSGTAPLVVGRGEVGLAEFLLSGGSANIGGPIYVMTTGAGDGTLESSTGILDVSGGSLTGGSMSMGNVGTAFANISGNGSLAVDGITVTRGEFNVSGSNAMITAGAGGFSVTDGADVGFTFDGSGISPVTITGGNMDFAGTNAGIFIDASAAPNDTYTLFSFSGYANGTENDSANRFGSVNLLNGTQGNLLYNADSIQFEVIPEPSTYAAIFGGLVLGLAVIRRRHQR